MKLKKLILKNFRSYSDQVTINISDLTTFIGKNDAGKSTLLEALEIFFNNKTVKIDNEDRCIFNPVEDVVIGCIFDNLPESITIDTSSETNLSNEYLVNKDGCLEIHKNFSGSSMRCKITAISYHPTNQQCNNLLSLKRAELRSKIRELGLSDVNLNSNADMRRNIWRHFDSDLNLATVPIDLEAEDGKKIWKQIENNLPIFSLFQSDRPSNDEDSEVQDPMKLAIKEALTTVEREIAEIDNKVSEYVKNVASRTLEKIKEMDEELSSELNVNFKSERNGIAYLNYL